MWSDCVVLSGMLNEFLAVSFVGLIGLEISLQHGGASSYGGGDFFYQNGKRTVCKVWQFNSMVFASSDKGNFSWVHNRFGLFVLIL